MSTWDAAAMEEGMKNLFQYEIGKDEQGDPIYAGVYQDNAGRWRANRVISTSVAPCTDEDEPQYSVQTARINIYGYAAYYGTLIGKRYYIDDANDKQTMYYFYNQVTGMWTPFLPPFPEGHKLYEFTQPCKFDRNNADGTYGLRSGYTGETGAGTPGEFIDETNVRTLAENFNDEGKQISRVNTLVAFHAGAHALTMNPDSWEKGSLQVTTLDDIMNPWGSGISLREALWYATRGVRALDGTITITFAPELFVDDDGNFVQPTIKLDDFDDFTLVLDQCLAGQEFTIDGSKSFIGDEENYTVQTDTARSVTILQPDELNGIL